MCHCRFTTAKPFIFLHALSLPMLRRAIAADATSICRQRHAAIDAGGVQMLTLPPLLIVCADIFYFSFADSAVA
jgi:hypothetical protein